MRQALISICAGVALAAMIACGGSSQSVQDIQKPSNPRPPYGSLNISIGANGETPTVRQLFLDQGQAGGYKRVWPQRVSNHQDNQGITIWRYDFIESANTDLSSRWYATLLVRVDDTTADGQVSFFGRGGSFPINSQILNPQNLFPNSVPETPENKKDSAVFLFLRQGNAVVLVDPATIGRLGPYGSFPSSTTVVTNIPGLDFPVGGAGLVRSSDDTEAAGITTALFDNQQQSDSGSTSGSTSASGSTTSTSTTTSALTTAATSMATDRVATTTVVSPVTSLWDVCFAWQPSRMGVSLTHGFVADVTAGGNYADGLVSATGGGFFMTTRPGSAAPREGVNTLGWTVLRTYQDPVWVLGWSADVAAVNGIVLGQSTETLTGKSTGNALTTAQVRGYVAGTMKSDARATVFQGDQDKNLLQGGQALLFEGTDLPMIGRSTSAQITGKFSQLVSAGRSRWYSQNGTPLGGDVPTSDQSLVDHYGTMLSFSAYLPMGVSK